MFSTGSDRSTGHMFEYLNVELNKRYKYYDKHQFLKGLESLIKSKSRNLYSLLYGNDVIVLGFFSFFILLLGILFSVAGVFSFVPFITNLGLVLCVLGLISCIYAFLLSFGFSLGFDSLMFHVRVYIGLFLCGGFSRFNLGVLAIDGVIRSKVIYFIANEFSTIEEVETFCKLTDSWSGDIGGAIVAAKSLTA